MGHDIVMPIEKKSPIYTSLHWAKSGRTNPLQIHLLEHHLADVGACFEALMKQPLIRRGLAHTAARKDLHEGVTARLSVIAALHDIGKANVGFQAQIWNAEDLVGRKKPGRAGHTTDLIPVLYGIDTQTLQWFQEALGLDEILGWDNDGGLTASAIFLAALSHHGAPLNVSAPMDSNSAIWRPLGELSPEKFVRRARRLVKKWFPAAFEPDAPPLPPMPAFQHMFLGLCMLADWVGSDKRFFPPCDQPDENYFEKATARASKAMETIGLDISKQHIRVDRLPRFSELFGLHHPPNCMQSRIRGLPLDHRVVVVESDTGSGKTEAALWRYAQMRKAGLVDGLYFALPTRAAATQMHWRVNEFTKRLFAEGQMPEPALAVPGYVRAGDATGKHLPDYKVLWNDRSHDDSHYRRWAAESAKKFLVSQIAVGTVDQAMMAVLKVRHSHLRAACLARNLLVVDEVHASDAYMRVILEKLLKAHVGAGGYAILMSATLGSVARRRWLHRPRGSNKKTAISLEAAINTPYPSIAVVGKAGEKLLSVGKTAPSKSVCIHAYPTMHEFSKVAMVALETARKGAKVLMIRNTVGHAVKSQQALENIAVGNDKQFLFDCGNQPTIHTGRFAATDRELLDGAVEAHLGKRRLPGGRIIIGTQTLEQSLDIDADLLITDLCPMDVLLQRIGRLHRHQANNPNRPVDCRTPKCIVLTPPTDDLTPLLTSGQGANGLGPKGYVYEDLLIVEATRRLVIANSSSGEPWQIPKMNRSLVEKATHPDALDALAKDLGEQWRIHAINREGEAIAESGIGRDALVRRELPFSDPDVVFGDKEERIRTRLGDEGIEIQFDPKPISPLCPSQPISSLAIPWHLSRGLEPDAPISAQETTGGFEFQVGKKRFQYDRLGLQSL